MHYVLLTGSTDRHAEARAAAPPSCPAPSSSFALHALPDGRLPEHWADVKRMLHEAGDGFTPDLVVSPWPGDAHQDHRLLGELVPTVCAASSPLHYEIPKWDGDLGRPNVYLPLTPELARRKVELLNKHFPSQTSSRLVGRGGLPRSGPAARHGGGYALRRSLPLH